MSHRPRDLGGRFVRRKPGVSTHMSNAEVAIILFAALLYTGILLTPLWAEWFRGN
jgi:hypothetical protein